MPIGAFRCSTRPVVRSTLASAARHSLRMASSKPFSPPATASSTPPAAADGQEPSATPEDSFEPLRMQIVIRRDLKTDLEWPEGAIIAQGSHASTAVLHKFRADPAVEEYLDRLESMHKVVWSTKNLDSLQKLSAKLSAQEPPIQHYVWVEQPENVPTALAVVPNRVEQGVLALIKKSKCSSWK